MKLAAVMYGFVVGRVDVEETIHSCGVAVAMIVSLTRSNRHEDRGAAMVHK